MVNAQQRTEYALKGLSWSSLHNKTRTYATILVGATWCLYLLPAWQQTMDF